MLSEPEVIERTAQPYVGIKADVTMDSIARVLPDLHGRVFDWLGQRGIAPAGAPFWRYNVIDMARIMEVEVAVPVASAVPADDQVLADTVPAGRYSSLRHTGDPSGLLQATASLLKWADEQHLTFDMVPTPDGDRWAARLEIYETDPTVEPDKTKWVTQLAFRLAD
jgi:effector-binding domain-containing protein